MLILRAGPTEEICKRRALGLRLLAWNLSEQPIRLMPFDELFAAEIVLSSYLFPGARSSDPLADKFMVFYLRCTLSLPKLSQHPVHRQLGRSRRFARRRTIAAPGPVTWPRHRLGSHGIQHHIAAEFQQARLLLHQNGDESPLKEMPHMAMTAVKNLGVAPLNCCIPRDKFGCGVAMRR